MCSTSSAMNHSGDGPRLGQHPAGDIVLALALAVAGSLAGARVHARTRATLDTAGPTFVAFLLGVIVIVGGLIYFPMLILGPIGERIIG
jgi:potassium-transporting ATPase potassium-binding subunit